MSGTVGGYGTLGGTAGNGYSQQQMMAQKLMEADKAPVANSSTESAAANTFAQGLKGVMGPSMMETARTGETPEWMKWIGKQFGGGADTTGIGSYPATPI